MFFSVAAAMYQQLPFGGKSNHAELHLQFTFLQSFIF